MSCYCKVTDVPLPRKQTHDDLVSSLKNMGFPSNRAKKALAATGYKSVNQARDWIYAHSQDPTIDNSVEREYFLYVVPTGELAKRLDDFWVLSKEKCGWNGAHNHIPHITLIPSFIIPDKNVEKIIHTISDITFTHSVHNITFDSYVSFNYMGMFVIRESLQNLKHIRKQLVNALSLQGVSFKTEDKSFHLTLAYKFNNSEFEVLKLLVEEMDVTDLKCKWEFRLYSRDPNFASSQVFKVLDFVQPKEESQWGLQIGDYVYIKESDLKNRENLWIEGTSWLTGLTALLPVESIKRTAITETWATIRLEDYQGPNKNCMKEVSSDKQYRLMKEVDCDDNEGSLKNEVSKNREIYIIRHGECVGFTFGKWISFSFNEHGEYIRKDLNMPRTLPKRTGGQQAFSKDCPLTNIGELQARLTGEIMKENGIKIKHVFVSPSLSCIQTAHGVLSGLGIENSTTQKIEPGLFEWQARHQCSLPDWMTNSELKECGFNIDTNYIPLMTKTALAEIRESMEEFYNREYRIITELLNRTEHSGGNFLLVGHSLTLDACSRQLVGKKPRGNLEATTFLHHVPYCSILCVYQLNDNTWCIKEPRFLPLTHANNTRFDQTVLL